MASDAAAEQAPIDPRLGIGGNLPPLVIQFDQATGRIVGNIKDLCELFGAYVEAASDQFVPRLEELEAEAAAMDAIEDELDAKAATDLLSGFAAWEDTVESDRKARRQELEQFRSVIQAKMQERLINRAQKACAPVRKLAGDYEIRKRDEERRRREEAARKARQEAEIAAREAAEARQIAERERRDREAAERQREAEDRARAAAAAAAEADHAVNVPAAEITRVRGHTGALMSLRTRWVVRRESIDRANVDLEECRSTLSIDAIASAIQRRVDTGLRSIRGALIEESSAPSVRR